MNFPQLLLSSLSASNPLFCPLRNHVVSAEGACRPAAAQGTNPWVRPGEQCLPRLPPGHVGCRPLRPRLEQQPAQGLCTTACCSLDGCLITPHCDRDTGVGHGPRRCPGGAAPEPAAWPPRLRERPCLCNQAAQCTQTPFFKGSGVLKQKLSKEKRVKNTLSSQKHIKVT